MTWWLCHSRKEKIGMSRMNEWKEANLVQTWTAANILFLRTELKAFLKSTINGEIFIVEIFLWVALPTKIYYSKINVQRISIYSKKHAHCVRQRCFPGCVVLSGPSLLCWTMSILHYIQPQDGLPNPRGDLMCSMNSKAIALANKEVLEATKTSSIDCSFLFSEKACTYETLSSEDGQLLYHLSWQ